MSDPDITKAAFSDLIQGLIELSKARPKDGSDAEEFSHNHCHGEHLCDLCVITTSQKLVANEIDRRLPVSQPTETEEE